MAGAFQSSAFQNSAFQTGEGVAAPAPVPVQVGGTRVRYVHGLKYWEEWEQGDPVPVAAKPVRKALKRPPEPLRPIEVRPLDWQAITAIARDAVRAAPAHKIDWAAVMKRWQDDDEDDIEMLLLS